MNRVFTFISALIAFVSVSYSAPAIEEVDRIRIAEVYRIGETLQDQLWPGWSTAPFGILFITDDHEFLIRHPKPNDEFASIGYDELLKSDVFVRPRKFQKNFLATFPAFGPTPVIVVGKAENTTDKTSSRWVAVLLHEHFHQLQYSRPGYFADVNALDLHGGDNTGMWQISYPFPYKDAAVAREFRELADLLLKAYEADSKKERETSLKTYLMKRREFSASLKPNDYKYASFQLWQEGVARYTQYKMAELAGRKYRPSKAFRSLPDFAPFDKEAERLLAATLKEMRDLDLAKWERTVFYPFGGVEGLLLDRVEPNWRSRYFNEKFALEKFYSTVESQHK
ncbi:MAG: hypothetical protein AB7V18_09430 [Pyrinomonadaceae bacterium]